MKNESLEFWENELKTPATKFWFVMLCILGAPFTWIAVLILFGVFGFLVNIVLFFVVWKIYQKRMKKETGDGGKLRIKPSFMFTGKRIGI